MSVCNFADAVIQQSKSYPQKIAYLDGIEELTYGTLIDRIQQVANGLISLGITAGTHVAISMEDCVDWPVAFLACIHQGIVPLPLSTTMGTDLFGKITQFADIKLVIAGKQHSAVSNNIPVITRQELQNFYSTQPVECDPVMLDPTAPAYLSLSSGSTGTPKVAVYGNKTFFEILALSPRVSFDMTHDSTIMSIAKMSWCFGMNNSVTYVVGLGATAVVIPDAPVPAVIADYANRFRPTIVASSPSVIKRLIQPGKTHYALPDSIHHFNSSGEHLPAIMYDQFLEQYGIRLGSSIGMMETCTSYSANPDAEHDRGTVGRALPGCEVKLMNGNIQVTEPNTVGEIYVKSPAAALYYYKNPAQTQATFIDGWVRTRDLGLRNERGNLVFVGRADDVFKVNDLLVSPVEIESIMLTNPTVQEVAVCRVQVNELNTLHAFLVPGPGFDLTAFRQWLPDQLFAHQIPKQIHLVESLAETMTFKKDRRSMSQAVEALC